MKLNLATDGFLQSLKLCRLRQLHTLHIEGISFSEKPTALESRLSLLLSRLESPFLKKITLTFDLHRFDDLDTFDWKSFQKVLRELNFFGLQRAEIIIRTLPTMDTSSHLSVEAWVRTALRDLDERDALTVSVVS